MKGVDIENEIKEAMGVITMKKYITIIFTLLFFTGCNTTGDEEVIRSLEKDCDGKMAVTYSTNGFIKTFSVECTEVKTSWFFE